MGSPRFGASTTADDLAAYWEDVEDAASDVAKSRHNSFKNALHNWIKTVEGVPAAAEAIRRCEAGVDFGSWYDLVTADAGGLGGGQLRWPAERHHRVGLQFALMRRFVAGEIDALGFLHEFVSSDTSLNVILNEAVDQLFQPLNRDVRRLIERRARDPDSFIPAADRTVTLDHNAPERKEVEASLEEIEKFLVGTNDYPDPEDREQRIAEVGALRKLLSSARAGAEAIIAVGYRPLRYLREKFADKAIGTLAGLVIEHLGKWTGLW